MPERFVSKKIKKNSLVSKQEKSTKKSKKNPLTKHTLGKALGSHRQWLETGEDHPIDFGNQPEKHLDTLHLFGS